MSIQSNKDKRKSLIRAEDQILYLCARQNFQNTHHEKVLEICRRAEIRWGAIYNTAHQHGVAPLVSHNLNKFNGQKIGVPEEIAENFNLATIHSIAIAGKRSDQLTKICELFEELSIDIMVIKGAAHEITVYDQPWYATANDLDIIIKMEPVEFKQSNRWELEDLKRDISLEEDFMVHHDVTMNNILPIDFGMIWDDASQIRFRDHDLFVMSPEDMLITSCINSCRKRYFRLKALFDIAEIINKFPDVNWADFVMKAKDYQVNKIIYTALWVTNETVGCAIPKTVFFDLDINPIRAQIIHRLIRKISTYSLMYPHSEHRILKRRANLSIVLPYASYNLDQAIRKIGYVWSTR